MPRPARDQTQADLLRSALFKWPEVEDRPAEDGMAVYSCPRFRKGRSRTRPSERAGYWLAGELRALKALGEFENPGVFKIVTFRGPQGTVRPTLTPAERDALNDHRNRGNNGSPRLTSG